MISFFPFPYPVSTPMGEGYAIYVSHAPMYENDCWCVQLDDGRILHFSTNQLRGVGNGTYDQPKPKPPEPERHYRDPKRNGLVWFSACARPKGQITDNLENVTCAACARLATVPDDMNPLFARPTPLERPPRERADAGVVHRRVPRGADRVIHCGAPGIPLFTEFEPAVTCPQCKLLKPPAEWGHE